MKTAAPSKNADKRATFTANTAILSRVEEAARQDGSAQNTVVSGLPTHIISAMAMEIALTLPKSANTTYLMDILSQLPPAQWMTTLITRLPLLNNIWTNILIGVPGVWSYAPSVVLKIAASLIIQQYIVQTHLDRTNPYGIYRFPSIKGIKTLQKDGSAAPVVLDMRPTQPNFQEKLQAFEDYRGERRNQRMKLIMFSLLVVAAAGLCYTWLRSSNAKALETMNHQIRQVSEYLADFAIGKAQSSMTYSQLARWLKDTETLTQGISFHQLLDAVPNPPNKFVFVGKEVANALSTLFNFAPCTPLSLHPIQDAYTYFESLGNVAVNTQPGGPLHGSGYFDKTFLAIEYVLEILKNPSIAAVLREVEAQNAFYQSLYAFKNLLQTVSITVFGSSLVTTIKELLQMHQEAHAAAQPWAINVQLNTSSVNFKNLGLRWEVSINQYSRHPVAFVLTLSKKLQNITLPSGRRVENNTFLQLIKLALQQSIKWIIIIEHTHKTLAIRIDNLLTDAECAQINAALTAQINAYEQQQAHLQQLREQIEKLPETTVSHAASPASTENDASSHTHRLPAATASATASATKRPWLSFFFNRKTGQEKHTEVTMPGTVTAPTGEQALLIAGANKNEHLYGYIAHDATGESIAHFKDQFAQYAHLVAAEKQPGIRRLSKEIFKMKTYDSQYARHRLYGFATIKQLDNNQTIRFIRFCVLDTKHTHHSYSQALGQLEKAKDNYLQSLATKDNLARP